MAEALLVVVVVVVKEGGGPDTLGGNVLRPFVKTGRCFSSQFNTINEE